jgi:hypothetical protein
VLQTGQTARMILSLITHIGTADWFIMEYRGKHYTIVQGPGSDSWKWTVRLDEKTVKSGTTKTRDFAEAFVVWVIDKALKKAKPKPPSD